jgi:hypothetical protein
VTADILIREDTGSFAVVRVIDPGVHVSAPYSRAIGLLDRWVAAERRAVDEFSAWIEGQAAQAHAEMRLLCDELGLPVAWAEVPEAHELPGAVALANEAYDLVEAMPDPAAELSQENLDREYALNNMVRQARRGWTPTRPVIVVDIPAPDLVQTGPQSRFARWFDEQLQRAEQWWRGKQAARDKRLGLGDE